MKAFVLCGIPGAGKTSYVQNLKAQNKHLSVVNGDDLRASLYGDTAHGGNWSEIWEMVENAVEEAAGLCRDVVIDGTHVRKDYRAEVITLLRSYGYTDIHAIVVDRPLAVCLQQNRQRSRQVPEHVIAQMHMDLQKSIEGICKEGFTSVSYVS